MFSTTGHHLIASEHVFMTLFHLIKVNMFLRDWVLLDCRDVFKDFVSFEKINVFSRDWMLFDCHYTRLDIF